MNQAELIRTIEQAQRDGKTSITGTLREPVRGCRYFALVNLDGKMNCNLRDIWVTSRSGYRTLGRISTPSRKHRQPCTDGWEDMILSFDD